MTFRLRLLGIGTLGVLALAACSSGASPSTAPTSEAPVASASEAASMEASPTPVEMTSVDFRLNWVIAGNHAPYFLAKQEGFWEDCGLDVSLAAGQGSGDTAQLVANGSQEFGLTDAVSISAGRVKGLPVKSLGVIYQTNPSAIVSYKDAGITQLTDVQGKTWGAVPSGSPSDSTPGRRARSTATAECSALPAPTGTSRSACRRPAWASPRSASTSPSCSPNTG